MALCVRLHRRLGEAHTPLEATFCSRAFVVSQLDSPQNILAHTYRKGDVVVWDELGGVLHSGTVFGPPYMRGERLLRKLPPGDARHKRRRRKGRE